MGDEAAYPDIQTEGSQLDPNVSIQGYTYDKLLEYWSMIYTLGLMAGVAGSPGEQEAARKAVFDALEGVAQEAMSLASAAVVAADDYTPPFAGAAVMSVGRGVMAGAQGVGKWFGYDPGLDKDIENLDQRIRDSVRVDVNQVSQMSKAAKATLEGASQYTGIGGYKADTSGEDALIRATQGTVDARQAQINAALTKIYNAIKDVALERYNQFISDWEKGGLNYALGTLGIDAAFLAIEIAIGVAAGIVTGGAGAVVLKVAVMIGKRAGALATSASRAIAVTLKRAGGNGGRTGTIPLSEGAVVRHAKDHNGFGDDHAKVPNSTHENKKDPGGPGDDKKLNNKAIGDAAEAQAKKDLAAKGFTDQKTITNPQGNGVDIIARNPTTGEVMFGEVKGNTATLSSDQAFMGGPRYVEDRLNRVITQSGEWANATDAQIADAITARNWLKQNPKFKEMKYDVDPDTGKASNYRDKDWNYPPGQRPKDLKWRDGDGKDIPKKKKPKRKPDATGPPPPPGIPFGGPR
jgi:Holliday junction resolvase-like predicted endonuclease